MDLIDERKDIENLDLRAVAKKYFDERGLVEFQIKSYENFTDDIIPETVCGTKITAVLPDKRKTVLTFGEISFDPASSIAKDGTSAIVTPNEARLRMMNYELSLNAAVTEEIFSPDGVLIDTVTTPRHHLGFIPLMVQSRMCTLAGKTQMERVASGECYHDLGGYFISKGYERVLISHERLKGNQPYCFKEKSSSKKKWGYTVEVRSFSKSSWAILNQIVEHDGSIGLVLPSLDVSVPVGFFLKLCNISTQEDAMKTIGYPPARKQITEIIREISNINKKRDALKAIAQLLPKSIPADKRIKTVKDVFFTEFLPHLGPDVKKKGLFLGYMLKKLFMRMDGTNDTDDDRDHFSNKRADVSGYMLGTLFKSAFKKFLKNIASYVEKKGSFKLALHFFRNDITNTLRSAMATGNWSAYKSINARKGVSDILTRLTYVAMFSHLRRLVTPTGKKGKVTQLRQLHSSQWGVVCPFETPEGEPCGIVKNFSLTTIVSVNISPIGVMKTMERDINFVGVNKVEFDDIANMAMIFINDDLVGYTFKPVELVTSQRRLRDLKKINWQVSIAYDHKNNEVKVYTDSGRCMRPVLVVKNSRLLIAAEDIAGKTFNSMVDEGLIQYIDSMETEWTKTVLYQKDIDEKTHYCEIDPYLILGVCASLVPYPNHNPAPRNAYEASMIKQALGMYSMAFALRYDNSGHVMIYNQKPLACTSTNNIEGFTEMSSGTNAIVAITTYGGWNQEDSIMMNQSAIDRGLFNSILTKTYNADEEPGDDYAVRKIEIPGPGARIRSYNYGKLGEDGIVPKGTKVEDCDVLIGRTSKNANGKKDMSVILPRGDGPCVVDSIFMGLNSKGVRLVRVRVSKMRIPKIGDKFASKQAQKGTLSKVYNQADGPFTAEGIVPDIIINPAALPSRMTGALLIESAKSKAAALSGEFADATAFSDPRFEEMAKLLSKEGYQRQGYEKMYCGYTGKPIKSMIFVGPIYYQRLKHMVEDKIHARSRGPVQMLVRQPVEGRSRGGGLRTGEMERDAIVAHGGSSMVLDRLNHNSDPFKVQVCGSCGIMSSNPEEECPLCAKKDHRLTNLPYATKYLFQELNAMGVDIRLKTV